MIEVYDKKYSTDALWGICVIIAIPCLICSAIIFIIYTNEEIANSLLLKTLSLSAAPPTAVMGILKILKSTQAHGPMGETSFLRIKDESISFLNRQVDIREIECVVVRIRNKKADGYFSGNNYLEIKTSSDKHELGLIIGSDKGIDSVEQLIKILKQNKVTVIYEKSI